MTKLKPRFGGAFFLGSVSGVGPGYEERDYRMGGAGRRLCLAFWKRSPITVRLTALLMVERSDQWPGPEDQVVTMIAAGSALLLSQ
jgi:hypothetical protein